MTPRDKLLAAIDDDRGRDGGAGRLSCASQGRELEAARLRQRTDFDLEMMREVGFCSGIENYSRHLAGREAGSRPWTLIDYFPTDFLLIVDESHITVPQVHGMYKNDRTRKEILVDFGFRLPSALDNRPLTFEEWEDHLNQVVYMSATPGPVRDASAPSGVAEQFIRPTGVVDPQITVRPTAGQVDDLLAEIRETVARGERAIVTTLTKKMAEDLADYLAELGIKVQWLHSEVDTLERVEILRDLRLGVYDVLVGINLLREGLDLPEVTLVAILDADKEGFLRSGGSLIQVIGRAARNIGGRVIMYADRETDRCGPRSRRPTAVARSRPPTTPSTGSCPRRSSRRSATSTRACAALPRSGPRSTSRQGAGRAGLDDDAARGPDEGGGAQPRVRARGCAARRDPAAASAARGAGRRSRRHPGRGVRGGRRGRGVRRRWAATPRAPRGLQHGGATEHHRGRLAPPSAAPPPPLTLA